MRTTLALALLLAPLAALAQSATDAPGLRDVMHARSIAMGEAYRGVGLGADILDGNPAMMSVYRRYQLELSGAWDPGNRFAYGSAAVCDSASNRVAAGLSYQLVSLGRAETRRTANLTTVAVGFPVFDFLHVGVAGRHLLMSGAETADAITVDAGLALKLGNSVALSAVGHNLIDVHHADLSRYYVFSGGFVGGPFSLGADLRADLGSPQTRLQYNAGAEYVLGTVPVRAGYTYDSATGSHYLSGGIGFFTEGGGLDFAYRQELNGPGRMLALTFRIQSATPGQ